MPTKRPDETQDAFVIRCIRDDEAESCIKAIESSGRHDSSDYGQAAAARAVEFVRARIEQRAQGWVRP